MFEDQDALTPGGTMMTTEWSMAPLELWTTFWIFSIFLARKYRTFIKFSKKFTIQTVKKSYKAIKQMCALKINYLSI